MQAKLWRLRAEKENRHAENKQRDLVRTDSAATACDDDVKNDDELLWMNSDQTLLWNRQKRFKSESDGRGKKAQKEQEPPSATAVRQSAILLPDAARRRDAPPQARTALGTLSGVFKTAGQSSTQESLRKALHVRDDEHNLSTALKDAENGCSTPSEVTPQELVEVLQETPCGSLCRIRCKAGVGWVRSCHLRSIESSSEGIQQETEEGDVQILIVSGAGHAAANGKYVREPDGVQEGGLPVWKHDTNVKYKIKWSTMSAVWTIDCAVGAAPYRMENSKDKTLPLDGLWVKHRSNGVAPNPSVKLMQDSAAPSRASTLASSNVSYSTNSPQAAAHADGVFEDPPDEEEWKPRRRLKKARCRIPDNDECAEDPRPMVPTARAAEHGPDRAEAPAAEPASAELGAASDVSMPPAAPQSVSVHADEPATVAADEPATVAAPSAVPSARAAHDEPMPSTEGPDAASTPHVAQLTAPPVAPAAVVPAEVRPEATRPVAQDDAGPPAKRQRLAGGIVNWLSRFPWRS